MVSLITVIRETTGCEGELIAIHDGKEYNFDILTGSPYQTFKSEWETGKSGIPTGKHYLWNAHNYILQKGQYNPKGGEIGEFHPISSDTKQHKYIYYYDEKTKTFIKKKYRKHEGLHPENDKLGSLGCVVVVNEFERLSKMLKQTPLIHIPFHVEWGK